MAGFSPVRLGDRCVAWMNAGHWTARGKVFDIGNTTEAALVRLANGVSWEGAGGQGEEENGNGSLMRILPIALRFHGESATELMRLAGDASRITHAHRRSQLACGFYCLVVAAMLRGATLLEAWEGAVPELEQRVRDAPDEAAAFARILEGRLVGAPREEIKSSGYVIHTLEAALWCAQRHTTLAGALLEAVNLGSDTDTTGCVAGGIAGAMYGFEAIPPEWVEVLPRRSEVDALLAEFIPACRTG